MRVPNYNARGWWLHASREELVEFLDSARNSIACYDEEPTSLLREWAAETHPLTLSASSGLPTDCRPIAEGLPNSHRMLAGTCTACGLEDLQPTGERSPESAAQKDHRLRELFRPALDGGLVALRNAVGAAVPRGAF